MGPVLQQLPLPIVVAERASDLGGQSYLGYRWVQASGRCWYGSKVPSGVGGAKVLVVPDAVDDGWGCGEAYPSSLRLFGLGLLCKMFLWWLLKIEVLQSWMQTQPPLQVYGQGSCSYQCHVGWLGCGEAAPRSLGLFWEGVRPRMCFWGLGSWR